MIQAICFDAFGTLVEITDKRRPFRALLQGGVDSITAEEVLTKPLNLRDVAARIGRGCRNPLLRGGAGETGSGHLPCGV
jgi:hypothetical protein